MADENGTHKGIHDGHRQRLLKKYTKGGIDSLEEHEILEVLLFFAFSRCNTNEISHILLNKFGSIENIFRASITDLTKINGIGSSSALLLKFLGDFSELYGRSDQKLYNLKAFENIIQFCNDHFIDKENENCHFIFLDKRKNLITHQSLTNCKFSLVNIDMKKVINNAIDVNSDSIIIVHNHPNGSSVASSNDVKYTRSIAEMLAPLELSLVDHIIIGTDGFFSMRRSNLMNDIWK